MTMWQGIDYIEKRLVLVNNRLSFVIAPGSAGPLPLEKALKYVEEASEVYDWLAPQRAPRGRAKRWVEHEPAKLGRSLQRASVIVKRRAEEATAPRSHGAWAFLNAGSSRGLGGRND